MARSLKLALLFLFLPGLVVGSFSIEHRISTSTVAHQQFIDPPWSAQLVLYPEPFDKVPPRFSAASSRQEHYRVVRGDTLSAIAQTFKVNLDNLAIVNKMNLWDILYVGRVLTIPDPLMAPPKVPLAWWPAGIPLTVLPTISHISTPVVVAMATGPSGWPNSCYGITNPDALWIIARESGCDVYAQNPSGACGIGQRMDSCDGFNGYAQAADMTRYVMSRYGSWSAARAFWGTHGYY